MYVHLLEWFMMYQKQFDSVYYTCNNGNKHIKLSPPSNHPSLIFIFKLPIQIRTLANGQWRLDNKGLDKQTNTCFLQVTIGAKTQCLSKDIRGGRGYTLLAEESIV